MALLIRLSRKIARVPMNRCLAQQLDSKFWEERALSWVSSSTQWRKSLCQQVTYTSKNMEPSADKRLGNRIPSADENAASDLTFLRNNLRS